jgi:hypothetical protein
MILLRRLSRRHGTPWRIAAAVVAAQAIAVLASSVAVPDAEAYRQWCRSDPVVVIDGAVADVFIAAPVEVLTEVTGPTQIVVTVPVEVDQTLAIPTSGFGQGEQVTFEASHRVQVTDGQIQVRIAVYVPASDDALPVQVEFSPRVVGLLSPATAEGTANTWIRLGTGL